MTQIRDYELFAIKQQHLSELVLKYSDVMRELDCLEESEHAQIIAEKIRSENFEIAVVGSFKNGKSTFINAMLGNEILPAYARPCTAIINEIRYGKKESAVIFLKKDLSEDQKEILPEWINKELDNCEYNNGINVPTEKLKEVLTIPMGESQEGFETPYSKMILYTPLELLKNHVIITDTPGLNEIETRTRITTNHLSRADAIIMVFSADKLCSRVEMDFVEKDLKANGFVSPFFVINRMDTLRVDSEKEEIKQLAVAKLSTHTRKGEQGIFFISARDAVDAIANDDKEMLNASNLIGFESALSNYLVNERGREKLLPAAELIVSKLERDILGEIIPQKQKGLNLGLQDAIIHQDAAEETLKKAAEKKKKIAEKINVNSERCIEDIFQLIDKFYVELVGKMCLWIDNYNPKSYDELNPRKKAEAIQKEILEYVSEQIKESVNNWYQETYKNALLQKIHMLDDLIQGEVEEFLRDIQNSRVAFFGDDDKLDVDDKDIANMSTSTASIVSTELVKNIGKSLGVAIGAGLAIELLTGLMNPILGIITAIGAITVGVFNSSQKIVPEIKEDLKKKLSDKLKSEERASSKKLKKEARGTFEKYKEQITKALDRKYNQAKNEIDSTVQKLKDGQKSIGEEKARLKVIENRSAELASCFKKFIGEL